MASCCRPSNEGTTAKEGGEGGSIPSFSPDSMVEEVDLLTLLKTTEFYVKSDAAKWNEKVGVQFSSALPSTTTLAHPLY